MPQNVLWSKYIQTTEELYRSRALRFCDATKSLWLHAIGAKTGDNVLEIGCAGGAFCHRLEEFLPGVKVTGLDLDSAHIECAKRKTAALGLQSEFVQGDATSMPFADNTFDVCYSHTVSEHIPHAPFFSEQYRVLKPGGRISVLSVRSRLSVKDENWFLMCGEERVLMEKAWSKAGNFDSEHNIGAYEMDEHEYPVALEKAGFKRVNVDMFTFVDYAPDNASVSEDVAVEQINCHRMHSLASMQKALHFSPDALHPAEQDTLVKLINARYDRRIEQYRGGERLWVFSTSTVLVASGRK